MLALAIILGLIANYLTGLLLRLFLIQHGTRISSKAACQLQLVAQIGKYVPGKIWSAVLQAQLIGRTPIVRLFLAGIDSTLMSTMLLSGLGLAFVAAVWSPTTGVLVAVLSTFVATRIAASALLARLSGMLARLKTKTQDSAPVAPTHNPSAYKFLLAAIAFSIPATLGYVTLLVATTDLRGAELSLATASVLLSWVLGALAIVVPGGFGVREVAFVMISKFMGLDLPLGVLASLAIFIRATLIIQDFLTALLTIPVFFRKK